MAKQPDPLHKATLGVAVEFATEFAEVMRSPLTDCKKRYLREVVAVTRAAAISGEYRDALRGYEVIGKALGHLVEEQKHLHLHAGGAASLAESSDAELLAFMKAPKSLPPPAEPPAPEPSQAEMDAFLADLDAVPVHA